LINNKLKGKEIAAKQANEQCDGKRIQIKIMEGEETGDGFRKKNKILTGICFPVSY